MIDAQEHQAIPRTAAVGDFGVALQVLGRRLFQAMGIQGLVHGKMEIFRNGMEMESDNP